MPIGKPYEDSDRQFSEPIYTSVDGFISFHDS